LVVALASLAFAACGPAETSFPPASTAAAAEQTSDAVEGSSRCPEGARVACIRVYGEHAGVQSCYEGERTCADGVWGPCLLPGEPDPADLHAE
jgi:hypothetical protein